MSRKVKVLVGVEEKVREEEIEIPDEALKPWDASDRLKYVGSKVPRVDGPAKTTGRATYTFDVQLPGMLHARFLRSPHPAAIVRTIDTSKAERHPGVKAVHLLQAPPMALHYAGQEILAIAATTAHAAEEALALVEITYDVKPFVVDMEKARLPGAPPVFTSAASEKKTAGDLPGSEESTPQQGNLRGPVVKKKMSGPDQSEAALEKILTSSDALVEATYRTQVQTHSCLETHGVVARWEDDGQLTVWASTQGTFSVRDDLAGSLNLPTSKVRVITDYMGGGFGSKFGAGVYGVAAAHLAKKAGAPVRLVYDRKEEHLSTGNRPSSAQTLRIGARKDGTLTAIKLTMYGTGGVGSGAGTAGPAQNMYACENIWTEETDVFTNAGPSAAFRAPGHPPGCYALEQAMDELAYRLKMDPLEFRRKNTTGDDVREAEYAIGAKRFGWDRRNPTPGADAGIVKRGVGVANSLWYYFYGTGFQVTVQVNGDGSVEVTNGVQDIGGGIRTAMAAIVAEELGLEPSQIRVRLGDTDFGLGPASGGSTTTGGMAAPTRDAAHAARTRMLEIAAPLLATAPEQLACDAGKIYIATDPSRALTWKQVASKIAGGKFSVHADRGKDYLRPPRSTIRGVQFAEVEVDTETGIVRVLRVVAVHDCGRPVNRLTLESQINGGIIQGISYALFENRILDRQKGIMVNPNLEEYKIAGIADTPEIEAIIIDNNTAVNSAPAMGIGEPATVPTSAAIANAIYHAIGVRVRELPMTPDRILAALGRGREG